MESHVIGGGDSVFIGGPGCRMCRVSRCVILSSYTVCSTTGNKKCGFRRSLTQVLRDPQSNYLLYFGCGCTSYHAPTLINCRVSRVLGVNQLYRSPMSTLQQSYISGYTSICIILRSHHQLSFRLSKDISINT